MPSTPAVLDVVAADRGLPSPRAARSREPAAGRTPTAPSSASTFTDRLAAERAFDGDGRSRRADRRAARDARARTAEGRPGAARRPSGSPARSRSTPNDLDGAAAHRRAAPAWSRSTTCSGCRPTTPPPGCCSRLPTAGAPWRPPGSTPSPTTSASVLPLAQPQRRGATACATTSPGSTRPAATPCAVACAFVRDSAEWLGITANGYPEHRRRERCSKHGPDAAASVAAALLPAEVDKVYLQHDLTVVSPGPLDAGVDARLRTHGRRREPRRWHPPTASRPPASTARSPRARRRRASARSSRTISLTGVPQPLDYLIAERRQRYGRVRVGRRASTTTGTRRSRATCAATTTAAAARSRSTRRSARSASSTTAPTGSSAGSPATSVFWALSDARYPVAAEDARRRHRRPPSAHGSRTARRRRRRRARSSTSSRACARSAHDGRRAPARQWLARQLDVAIRAKQTVDVERGACPTARPSTTCSSRPASGGGGCADATGGRHRAHAAAVEHHAAVATRAVARKPPSSRA